MQTLLGATALSLAAPACAWAQSSIEEIVVTARKREESLQEVPVAVSTLAGDQLQAQGINNNQDLGRSVPSLVTAAHPISASTVTFTMRGQRTGDASTTVDRPVGVYSDGINVARIRGMSGVFFDIDRIEVLKGPQGTLYGRNTTGGAVNIISRDADYNGVHGYMSADVGSYRLFAPRFAVNVPLIEDKLTVRLGAQGTFREGFGESVTTGQDIGFDRNQIIARATVIADPWEGVNLRAKAEFYRAKENGTLLTALGLTPNAPATIAVANQLGLANPTSAAARAQAAAVLAGQFVRGEGDYDRAFDEMVKTDDFEAHNFSFTATFDLSDDVQLKSITGYREFVNNQTFDYDGTSFRILAVGVGRNGEPAVQGVPGLPPTPFQTDPGPEQENEFFSQEFNLAGGALDDRLSWLGGFYYSRELGSDAQAAQALPPVVSTVSITDGAKVYNSSWSIYTQNEFKITDQLSIQGGYRYTEERKALDVRGRAFNPQTNTITCLTGVAGVFPADNPDACLVRNERIFDGSSWMLGVSYKVNEDVLVYARVARGFKGGALQLRQPLAPQSALKATGSIAACA
jgi:iron complex outermembrane receptor protein